MRCLRHLDKKIFARIEAPVNPLKLDPKSKRGIQQTCNAGKFGSNSG
jgi:hypothetical protein